MYIKLYMLVKVMPLTGVVSSIIMLMHSNKCAQNSYRTIRSRHLLFCKFFCLLLSIFLKSVCLSVSVRKLQVAILARSSREMSNCSHRLTVYPVTSSRLSSA